MNGSLAVKIQCKRVSQQLRKRPAGFKSLFMEITKILSIEVNDKNVSAVGRKSPAGFAVDDAHQQQNRDLSRAFKIPDHPYMT